MNNTAVNLDNLGSASHEPADIHSKGAQTRRNRWLAVAAGLIVLLVLLLGGWFLYRSSTAAVIDESKYQAVFFTNGQVYFGKLSKLNGSYLQLTDVYYLQAQKTADATEDSKNPQVASTEQSADVELVKLGSEVHGPEDEMIISSEQVLFFENLKEDGKVARSIASQRNR